MKRDELAIIFSIALTGLLGGGGLWFSERTDEQGAVTVAVFEEAHAAEDIPERIYQPREIEVPILVYHTVRPWRKSDGPNARAYNVAPATFEAQMVYLAEKGYESISFDDFEEAMFYGGELPEKPVLITLDDGTSSHYEHAFPVMEKYGFTGTFFLFSNAIDRPNYLSAAQVLEMQEAGMRFGNHTRYHQYLTRLPEEEMLNEMQVAKDDLEALLQEEMDILAYPFGLHDERVEVAAKEMGHIMGRTIKEGRVHKPENVMSLPGYQINDSLARLRYALGE